MHVDMIDYFTAQRDLLSVPMPLLGIKMPQDRARLGIFICPICAEYGTRWTIPTWAHLITHIQRHHSGRWVDKKLAKFLRKSKIRMLMRPFRYPDSSQTTEWARRPNLRRDIEAARQGSNEVWANAPNPFKIRSGDWVWCSEAGTHTRAISASDRIPLHPYRAVHGHTLNTCQPAIRLCPPLLVSDWVSTRRVNRACRWRSPDHADLQLPLLHYQIRGVVQGGQPRGDEQGGTWGTCTLACAKDTSGETMAASSKATL